VGANECCKDDPRYYTTAHWISNDRIQRKLRFVDFNMTNLKQRILNLSTGGATAIETTTRMDASFNRLFSFRLDSGEGFVAKMPTDAIAMKEWTLNSDVATMDYRRSYFSLVSKWGLGFVMTDY
jgi:hypothetical protein